MAVVSSRLRFQVVGKSPVCHWCGYAGDAGDFDVDHLTPRSQGGGEGLDNLVAACTSCNRSRQDRPASEAQVWVRRSIYLRQSPEEQMADALAVMASVLNRRRALVA